MNQLGIQPPLLSCLVIEPDASIRWMLSFLLQDTPSNVRVAQIGAECESLEQGLVRLDALRTSDRPVQVVLLGSALETVDALMPVVAAIARFAPEVAIVVLGQLPASLSVVRELGVAGYWWKGDRPEALLEILSRLQPAPTTAKPSRVVVSPAIAALGRLSRSANVDDLNSLGLSGLGLSGLGLIDTRFSTFDRALAQLDFQLRSQRLNRPRRWFLQGRIREILAARWIARQIFEQQIFSQQPFSQQPFSQQRSPRQTVNGSAPNRSATPNAQRFGSQGSGQTSRLAVGPATPRTNAIQSGALRFEESGFEGSEFEGSGFESRQSRSLMHEIDWLSRIFDQFIVKLDTARTAPLGGFDNLSPLPLELDLLNDALKVELLTLIAQVLQAETQALRSERLGLAALYDRVPLILETVWSVVVTQFFRDDFFTDSLENSPSRLESLLRSRPMVTQLLLQRIPLVTDWVGYGLLEMPLSLDQPPYEPGTPQADRRALLLLENTIISLANAVLQPLLNQFSEVEWVKRRYFHRNYVSSRELARFRNDLSWRYRRDRWLDTPKDIFESQYRIYHLSPQGIAETKLYAPRQSELQSLSGLPLGVTLLLETRDAITPRLKATFGFLGTGVVYFLTEIVGRGIGLVGQGIVKGIGNAWQERR